VICTVCPKKRDQKQIYVFVDLSLMLNYRVYDGKNVLQNLNRNIVKFAEPIL